MVAAPTSQTQSTTASMLSDTCTFYNTEDTYFIQCTSSGLSLEKLHSTTTTSSSPASKESKDSRSKVGPRKSNMSTMRSKSGTELALPLPPTTTSSEESESTPPGLLNKVERHKPSKILQQITALNLAKEKKKKAAEILQARPPIMSLSLELKQQICEEVLVDLNHNKISTAERSTNLEDHYRTFRLQAHVLSLVPGFTFANEWVKKKQTPLQILYATLHDLDVTFRYNSITGAMYVNYPYPPLYPPFPSDEPLHLIIELRSDDDWGFPLDNILWWHHRVLQDVQ